MLLSIFVCLLSIQSPTLLPTDDSIWVLNYNEALQIAEQNNKPILVVFTGSDWCKNCIALEKEIFENATFKEYAEKNLVLLRVDFPRSRKNTKYGMDEDKRNALAEKFNTSGTFPYMVLIDSDEKQKANIGYVKGGIQSYLDFFESNIPKP